MLSFRARSDVTTSVVLGRRSIIFQGTCLHSASGGRIFNHGKSSHQTTSSRPSEHLTDPQAEPTGEPLWQPREQAAQNFQPPQEGRGQEENKKHRSHQSEEDCGF